MNSSSPEGTVTDMKDMEEEEVRLCLDYIREQAEIMFKTRPKDLDNLITWAAALFGLSYFTKPYTYDQTVGMIEAVLNILQEASSVEETNVLALWLSGKAFTSKANLTINSDDAVPHYELATSLFDVACDLEPKNELFKVSFEQSLEASERHPMRLIKAPEDLKKLSIPKSIKDMPAGDSETELVFEYALKTAELMHSEDPNNVDKITRLATTILLSWNYGIPGAKEKLQVAISKLEHVLRDLPENPYVHWCLGKALTEQALLASEPCIAMQLFERATESFQKAFEMDPKSELFKYSLDKSSKVPMLEPEPAQLDQQDA